MKNRCLNDTIWKQHGEDTAKYSIIRKPKALSFSSVSSKVAKTLFALSWCLTDVSSYWVLCASPPTSKQTRPFQSQLFQWHCTVWQWPPATTNTVLPTVPSEAVIIKLRNIGKSCLNAFKLFDAISSVLKKKMHSAEGVLMSYFFWPASINLWQQTNGCSLGSSK